jgi:hypothetical protein
MTARIDRDAVSRELTDVLDRIDVEEERAREASKRARERIGGLKDKARELRDVLAGRRGVQLPMPAAVLDEAREVKARKGTDHERT